MKVIFEEGDKVKIKRGQNTKPNGDGQYGCYRIGDIGEVMSKEVNAKSGNASIRFSCTLTVAGDELELISEEEYLNAQPKKNPKLKVDTLEYEIEIQPERVKVGCQSITKSDALRVAKFLTENLAGAPF